MSRPCILSLRITNPFHVCKAVSVLPSRLSVLLAIAVHNEHTQCNSSRIMITSQVGVG